MKLGQWIFLLLIAWKPQHFNMLMECVINAPWYKAWWVTPDEILPACKDVVEVTA